MADENQLIDRALAGDRAAFTRLVEDNQDRLFASMLQVTGSPDEAEEVVQDAFIRAFIKLDTFKRNSQFFTWLYRIAFNSALTRRRRTRDLHRNRRSPAPPRALASRLGDPLRPTGGRAGRDDPRRRRRPLPNSLPGGWILAARRPR